MSNKHTPEPWKIGQYEAVRGLSGMLFDSDGDHLGTTFNGLEDARRIVACVNACRGLPTDELEQKGLVAAVGTELLKADDRAEAQEAEIRRLAHVAAEAENKLAEALNRCDQLWGSSALAIRLITELAQDETLPGHMKGSLTGLAEGLRMRVAAARGAS